MPDMKNAMQKAGLSSSPAPGSRPAEKRSSGGEPGGACRDCFPPGYPVYFGPDGHTRPDLLLREAEDIAACLESAKLRRHQLRAFYGHAKLQLQRLQNGASFGEIHADIAKLKAFAADRAGRRDNALPEPFKRFIDLNVNAVRDKHSFEKGFMLHFEAVVAYCARIRE